MTCHSSGGRERQAQAALSSLGVPSQAGMRGLGIRASPKLADTYCTVPLRCETTCKLQRGGAAATPAAVEAFTQWATRPEPPTQHAAAPQS